MQHKMLLTGRVPTKGSKKLQMADTPFYKAFVRTVQMMDKFDRVCLSAVLCSYAVPVNKQTYTLVNDKLGELYDNGFLEAVPVDTTRGRLYTQHEHYRDDFEQNPELAGVVPFLKSTRVEVVLQKSATWPDFMTLWKEFIEE